MGYYIYADLEVKNKKEKEIIAEFRRINGKASLAFDENGGRDNDVSWTECDEDLMDFSKKYPKTLFTMYIEGSGVMDFWVLYVKNGKFQKEEGQITYPKYNPKKLK